MSTVQAVTDTTDIFATFRRCIAPSNPPTAFEWVSEHYALSHIDSAAPGSISLDPWQEEVIQAFDDPTTRKVVVCASSQVGKTVLGLALAQYCAIHQPSPILYLAESDLAATSLAKDRVFPAIEVNETADYLAGKRSTAGQTTNRLAFTTGAVLTIAGAQTPSNVSSRPIRFVFGTEVRGWPLNIGGNGDPLTLAAARMKSFGTRAKMFLESSPGSAGKCRLTQEALLGDCRRYALRCPHCDAARPVSFFPEKGSHTVSYNPANLATAGIVCTDCGVIWTDQERLEAIRNGHFEPTREPKDPTVASFFYSELESPRSTVQSIVKRYLEARQNPSLLRAFYNTVLGLVFDESVLEDRTDPHALSKRAEPYDARILLPMGALVVTAGVDVQDDRLEAQVIATGENGERWILDYRVFRGDPAGLTVFNELTDYLINWRGKHPLGGALEIRSTCIDSGGHHTETVKSYSLAMQQKGRAIFAIKGVPNGPRNQRDIVARAARAKLSPDHPNPLLLVGVDTIKTSLFHALKKDMPGEGFIHFPLSLPEGYFHGLTTEYATFKIDKRGYMTTQIVRSDYAHRNESLDTLVYAIAAYHHIAPDPDFGEVRARLIAAGNAVPSKQQVGLKEALAAAQAAANRRS
ncbi:MAG: phage terminase large subunit family protein [Ancalomicrobiaceae bacterium]|nr:phage terminase large subunit family protein [Ancalomicrobiaceae bacterium]